MSTLESRMGRKLYYDKTTGHIIAEIGERDMYAVQTTVEQDIAVFRELSERNKDSFDFIQLEYGEYRQDFLESSGYRVNPETKELEFSYPNPNEPEAPPVYNKPLSEEIERLKVEDLNNKEAIAELYLLSMGGI